MADYKNEKQQNNKHKYLPSDKYTKYYRNEFNETIEEIVDAKKKQEERELKEEEHEGVQQ